MDWASSEWMQELSPAALQKVKGLEEQVEWMHKERQQKMLKIDNLEQTIQNQKLKLEEEKAENAPLRRDVQKLEDRCKDCENKQARLQNEVQMRDAKISLLENQLKQLKANLDTVPQFEVDIAHHKTQLEKAEQKSVELELALKGQEETNLQLQKQLTALKSQLDVFSASSDLMVFDSEKPEQEISAFKQQISDQENIINELKLKLSNMSIVKTVEDVKSESLASKSISESQDDHFWNKFESCSSSDLRRSVRAKSDSMLLPSQEEAKEKVLVLERLQQVSRELDCLRSNSGVIKAQMEQKFKNNEKELQAEIRHQVQVIADLESRLHETKTNLQYNITQTNRELDVTKLQLDKTTRIKLKLDDEVNQLVIQVLDINDVLKSKENSIVELLRAKEALETEKEDLFSKCEKLVFENDCLSLEIKKKNTVLNVKEPLVKIDQTENDLTSENTNVIDELQGKCDDLEAKQHCLKEGIKTLQEELSQTNTAIQDKIHTLDAMESELLILKNENEEKIVLNSGLQENNATLSKENSNLQSDTDQKTKDLSILEKEFALMKVAFEEMSSGKKCVEINYKQLQAEKDLLEETVKILEGEREQTVTDNKTQTDVINSTMKELSDLKNDFEQQTLAYTVLKDCEIQLTTQLENMAKQINELQTINFVSQSDIKVKGDLITSLETEIVSWKNTAEQQLVHLDELKVENEDRKHNEQSLQSVVELLEQEIQLASTNYKENGHALELAKEELLSLKKDYDEETSAKKQLEMSLSEISSHLEIVQGKLKEYEEHNLSLESYLDKNTTVMAVLKEKILTAQTTSEEQLMVQNELEIENRELQEHNIAFETEVESLKQEINIKNKEFDSTVEELSSLKIEHEEKLLVIEKLRQSDAECNVELKTKLENLIHLKEKLHSSESDLVKKEERISSYIEETTNIKETLERQLKVMNDLELCNQDLKDQRKSLQEKMANLEEDLLKANSTIEVQNKALVSVGDELSILKNKFEEKIEINEQLQVKNQTLAEEKKNLQLEVETEKLAISENENTIRTSLKQEVDKQAKEAEELNFQLKISQEQLVELRERIEVSALDTAEKNDVITSLQSEISSLNLSLEEQCQLVNSLQISSQQDKEQKAILETKLESLGQGMLALGLDIKSKNDILNLIKQEISDLKLHSDEKSSQMKGLIDTLIEVDGQLKPVDGLLREIEIKMQIMESELHERDNTISALREKVEVCKLSSEKQETVKHAQEAEVFRYKMDNECLEQALQELKVKAASEARFELEQTIDLKVSLLQKNPSYSQKFSESDIQEIRDIATVIPTDDILSYYELLAEEIMELKTQVDEIQEIKKQNGDQQVVINNLEKELQLSEGNLNLKDIALQEITNSLNLQKAALEDKKEELKLMEVEFNGFKAVCDELNSALCQSQDKYYQLRIQVMGDRSSNLQSTQERLLEQHTLAINLKEKLLRENHLLTELLEHFIEIKDLAVNCLHSFEQHIPELESNYGLFCYIKYIMKELHLAAIKMVDKQNENEKVIADKDNYSRALLNLLHVYDSTVSEKSSTAKLLQEKLKSEKGFVASLTQALYERNVCFENQEKLTFKLKDDLEKVLQGAVTAENIAKEEREVFLKQLDLLQRKQNEEREEILHNISNKEQACVEMEKIIKELEENLQRTNDKNKELHKEIQHVTGGLKDLQTVITENKETFYSPAQYEALEAKTKVFQQNAESLKENNSKISDMLQRIETAVLFMFNEFPCNEIKYSSLEDIPLVIQKLEEGFAQQRNELAEEKLALQVKSKEIEVLEKSVEELMNKIVVDTCMLVEKTQENEKLQVCLKEADNQLQCYCENAEEREREVFDFKGQQKASTQHIQELQEHLTSLKFANSKLSLTIEEMDRSFQRASLEKQQLKQSLDTILVKHICNYEDTYTLLNSIPAAVQKLCDETMQQKAELDIGKFTVDLKNEEIATFKASVKNLMEQVEATTHLLAAKDQQIQLLQIKLGESEHQIENYSQNFKGQKLEISDWEMKFGAMSKSNEELQKQLASSDSINSMLVSTNDEIGEKLNISCCERRRLKDALDKILASHITDYEDTCTSLDAIPVIVQRLCSKLMQQESNNKGLIKTIDADASHLVERDQHIQKLEIKLKEFQEQTESCCQEITDKDQEINDWKEKYVDANNSATELQRDLNAIVLNISIMEEAVGKVEENLRKVQIEKQQLKDILDKILTEHVPNYEKNCASFDNIPACIQILCEESAQEKNKIEELKLASHLRNEEIKASEARVEELMEKVDLSNNLMAEKAEEIQQLQIQQQEYKIQIQSFSQNFEAKECEISDWKMKYDETKKYVNEFQSQLASLGSENAKLISTVDEVKENLQKVTFERKQLKNSLDKILAECLSSGDGNSLTLEDISVTVQKLCDKFVQQKNGINEIKLTLDLKHEEIIAFEKSTKDAMEKNNANANLLVEKAQEIEQLRNKLEESDNQLQSYCKDFNIKENEISEWKLKFTASSNSIEELQKQVMTLESANAMLNSTIDEVEENLQAVYLERQQLTDSLRKILVEHSSNFEEVCKSFEDIPVAIQNLCNEFMQKKNEADVLKLTAELRNEDLASVEKTNEKLKEDISFNAAILTEKVQEIQLLQTKLAESESQLQRYCTDVSSKDSEIYDWKLQCDEFFNSMEELKNKLIAAESANVMLNSTIDEVEENLQKVYLEKQELKDFIGNILEEHVSDYKNVCSSLEDIPVIIKQLCNELTQQKHKIHEGKLTIDAKNEEILTFEASTKELVGKLNGKTDILNKTNLEVEQLQIKLKELVYQLESCHIDIENKEREISDWKISCNTHKASLDELQKEMDTSKSTNLMLTSTIDEMEGKLQNIHQEEQQKLDRIMAEHASSYAVSQQEVFTLKSKFDRNKKSFSTFEHAISSANDMICETKERVAMLIQLIQQYQENIEKLKCENQEKANFIVKQELVAKETQDLLENHKLSIKNLQNLNFEITQRCKESDEKFCSMSQKQKQLLQQIKNLSDNNLNAENEALEQAVLNWKMKFEDHISSCILLNRTNNLPETNISPSDTEIKDQGNLPLHISELKIQLQTLETKEIVLESELSILRSASDESKLAKQVLETRIEQLENDLVSSKQKLNNQLCLVQKKSEDIENMNVDINNFKHENEELQSRKDILQEKLKKLDTELIQCKSDCRTTSNNLEMLKLEHTPLVSENESLRSIISDLKVRVEINAEIPIWKNEQLGNQDEDVKDTETVKKCSISNTENVSGVLLKEFFENATKILNLVAILKGDKVPVTAQSNENTGIETSEVSLKTDESQLQFSNTLQSLASLDEKLSSLIAKMYPESLPQGADLELSNENQDVLIILKEFRNCLSTLCTCLQTFKNSSEGFNKKLDQEMQQTLRADTTAHSSNASKISELEDQIKKLTAEKQSLGGKMGLMKNNSYRLEKCFLSLQKQYAELQEKAQKQKNNPTSHEKEPSELEQKLKELSEELQTANENLEKSQTELLCAYSSHAQTQKKFDASRRQCQSLRAHLQHFQNKLQEKTDSSNVSTVKTMPLKEGAQDASSTIEEHTSKLCKTTGKENYLPDT